MLLIPCPWCGDRDETEFHYGGQAHVPYPADPARSSDAEWGAYLFVRDNPQGPVRRALGAHARAAGAGSTCVRDTATHACWARLPDRRAAPEARMSGMRRRRPRSTARAPLGFTLRRRRATRASRGDTLASALLANGVDVVGAEHPPRPPARDLRGRRARSRTRSSRSSGRRSEPMLRATEVELFDGLAARGAAPAAARLAAPRPTPRLRPACTRTATCSSSAAGRPGCAAADGRARTGARVILAETAPSCGRARPATAGPSARWAARARDGGRRRGAAAHRPRSACYDAATSSLAERRTDHLARAPPRRVARAAVARARAPRRARHRRARAAASCSPATTCPGVMLAGAAREYLEPLRRASPGRAPSC